ncbi:MAG: UDP-N-acetylmuramate dehydrogenase [Bacteroidales bacterium]|nr:UDP-N-acetylmuramate dehydrogenase [Bacteroidales bacterium]MBN2819832.1 UDP-N-acetylmuramate dehydrogenase [Bacteroidales bacterium]
MIIHNNFPLKDFNTFGVDASAARYIELYNKSDVEEFSEKILNPAEQLLILGGGSNVLFTDNFKGTVIHSAIDDSTILNEDEANVYIEAGSGIEWDRFVEYTVTKAWGGIENLSDIPGCVGAAPVQNIGAYGVEAKDTISSVKAFDLINKLWIEFSNTECEFGYRSSVFKKPESKNLLITHVTFKLSKLPVLNTSYGHLATEFNKEKTKDIASLRKVIKKIRASKLPSVSEIASAGSFFKNPVLIGEVFESLHSNYPEMPFYKQENNLFKIPAAWLIEQSGLKGYKSGQVGTFEKQPLVIINYGNASGKEIVDFSKNIQKKVFDKFGVSLEPEVCFV